MLTNEQIDEAVCLGEEYGMESGEWLGFTPEELARFIADVRSIATNEANERCAKKCPSGTLTQKDVDTMSLDSTRLRWLLNDHADPESRRQQRELCDRLSIMTYSSGTNAIDVCIKEEMEREARIATAQQPKEPT